MKVLFLTIENFRGIKRADIQFGLHDVLIGPNSSGKSTIIDAMSLVFGRTRLVRDLTEHDFHGSHPEASTRIRIIATLGGYSSDDPGRHSGWFRDDRAVPKWWNHGTGKVEAEKTERAPELCAQIAFAARFDLEDLVVEQVRYFHDDDSIEDPFQENAVEPIPNHLFDDIGYYVLPARRTWESVATFASDLFRKAVATVGDIPAQTILDERDRLRSPVQPLEASPGIISLASRINSQLSHLLPHSPNFQLRLTATDSESILRALVPHYHGSDGPALPVGRHGMGLLSLQSFILLLELGRERRSQGKPFLLAMEEPELHIQPGIQRRLIAQAISISEQTICTSHSPRVASFYPAFAVQILDRRASNVKSTPLLNRPLDATASNAARKLYNEDRPRVVEALMHHRVLIPEGRSEYEWFRLLVDVLETFDQVATLSDLENPSFGTVACVVPTHDSAVSETYGRLRGLRGGILPLVDGDGEGNSKVEEFLRLEPCPEIVLQWKESWTIENAIGWILNGSSSPQVLVDLKQSIDREFGSIEDLVSLFKIDSGRGRLKTDYLAYEEVVSIIGKHEECRARANRLLTAISSACLGSFERSTFLVRDPIRSRENCAVIRIAP